MASSAQDIRALALENRTDDLGKLLATDIEQVARVYPWVRDLKEANIPELDIVKALVETENVRWRADPPDVIPARHHWRANPEQRAIPEELEHSQGLCAHKLSKVLGERELRPIRHETTSDLSDWRHAIPDKREQTVFRHCGIGGILHPSMKSTQWSASGRLRSHGGTVNVLYAVKDFQPDSPVFEDFMFQPSNSEPAQQLSESLTLIQQLYGRHLAPSKLMLLLVPLNLPLLLRERFSVTRFDNSLLYGPQAGIIAQLRFCLGALQSVLEAMQDLNTLGGCCDSFPVFVSSRTSNRLRALDIRFSMLQRGAQLLSRPLLASNTSGMLGEGEWRRQISIWGLSFIEEWFESRDEGRFLLYRFQKHHDGAITFGVHVAALCAQMASIGLATFCRGHCSEFFMPHISRSIERFYLRGVIESGPYIVAERVGLSCLGEMLQRPVWAFSLNGTLSPDPGSILKKYDVEGTISQLFDIWDGKIVKHESKFYPRLGNGFLSKAGWSISSVLTPELMLHWSSTSAKTGLPLSYFQDDTRVVVGAITVNAQCSLSWDVCQKHLAGTLVELRTHPGGFKRSSKTKGVTAGFSGGAMAPGSATATFSVTDVRFDPTFVKGSHLKQWNENNSLMVLNAPWGLEFSLCTGVARRVPLRALLNPRVTMYLESRIPDKTLDRDVISKIQQTPSNEEAAAIWNDLAKTNNTQFEALKAAVKFFMEALQLSRLDDKKNLLLWWPEPSGSTDNGVKVDQIWYDRKAWIPILEDTESCALFGLATSLCLEDSETGRRCQNQTAANARPLNDKSALIFSTGIQSRVMLPQDLDLTAGLYILLNSYKAERHVFKVKRAPTIENRLCILEYCGKWSMPAIWLKSINISVVESADLIALGHEVVVQHRGSEM